MTLETTWDSVIRAPEGEMKSRVFSLLVEAGHRLRRDAVDDPEILSLVPRLWDLIDNRPELESYRELLSAFSRSCGLWNYIDAGSADDRDAFVAASVTAPELDGVVFHREQVAALNVLLAGRNLILSAPTSFGKSLLVDALLATERFRRVAIVVPTIALLDETRRRLSRKFGERFPVVMYSEEAAPEGNAIFLGTQERLINRRDIGRLDLLVVDEFYKLDPHRDDERSVTLNSAVYRLLKDANQFFFLGPNIENVRVATDGRWRFEFLKTRFSTVAVDTYDMRGTEDQVQRLIFEASQLSNMPALVFASSPDRANALAAEFAASVHVGRGDALAGWVDENYGSGWDITTAIRAGVGVHHGRIPRALASRLVHEFNSGAVPILICTSTLIEGVNTAAKSVLIYDKQINRKDYDFFTYSNIRGRAGRLGKHLVGNVYLFHGEPERTETEVSAPLFDDLNAAPDDMLIYLDDDDRGEVANDRLQVLRDQVDLSGEELRVAASIGLEKAIAVRQLVLDRYSEDRRLNWSGTRPMTILWRYAR